MGWFSKKNYPMRVHLIRNFFTEEKTVSKVIKKSIDLDKEDTIHLIRLLREGGESSIFINKKEYNKLKSLSEKYKDILVVHHAAYHDREEGTSRKIC